MKKRLLANEQVLQKQIIKYCVLNKIAVLRVNGASFADKTRYVRSYIYTSANLKDCSAGFPDLILFYNSSVLLAEIKVGDNKLTSAQDIFHDDIKKYCPNIYIFRSIKEAIDLINKWRNDVQ